MPNSNIKIVYSLRVHLGLQNMGFNPITEMKNPHKEGLNCWVYEETEEFLKAFDSLLSDGGNGHGKR